MTYFAFPRVFCAGWGGWPSSDEGSAAAFDFDFDFDFLGLSVLVSAGTRAAAVAWARVS
jgi:hypothetical protein